MSETIKKLGEAIGELIVPYQRPELVESDRDDSPLVRCIMCDTIGSMYEPINHLPGCKAAKIMMAFYEHHRQVGDAKLVVPDKMPIQGIYSNMLTLVTLHHVLVNSGLPAEKTGELCSTITGTMIGLVKQMKGHIRGRTVIDQVLELVAPANGSTPE
jgi:hypothetical protein